MADVEPAREVIVLVVEDDPLLRVLAADMVHEAGFAAIQAANATEALAVLNRRTDISIVFTDIDMPDGIDGLELARKIHDRWPVIDIIIASGQILPPESSMPPGSVFHAKPYRQSRIIAQMQRMAA